MDNRMFFTTCELIFLPNYAELIFDGLKKNPYVLAIKPITNHKYKHYYANIVLATGKKKHSK